MKKIFCSAVLFLSAFFTYAQSNTDPWPSSGGVGIGSTDHSLGLLQVTAASGSINALCLVDPATYSAMPQSAISFVGAYNSGGSNAKFAIAYGGKENGTDGDNAGFFGIYTHPNGGSLTERFRLTSDGKMGIGTTSPAFNLDISDGTAGFQFNNSNQMIGGWYGDGGSVALIGGTPSDASHGGMVWLGGAARGDNGKSAVQFFSNGTEYMRVDGNASGHTAGYVGIGTVAPTAALEVNVAGSARHDGSLSRFLQPGLTSGNDNSILFGKSAATNEGGFIGYAYDSSNSFIYINHYGDAASLVIQKGGNVAIGTTDAQGYKLAVNGSMIAESVKIKLHGSWPDYVFSSSYALPDLDETEAFIHQNHHLPGIPSAEEVKKDGIDLEDMNTKLLAKIEELTLLLIAQQKQLDELKTKVDKVSAKP